MTVGLCALHVWAYGCVKCLYIFGTDMIFGRDIDGVHWVNPNDFGDSPTLNLVAPVGQSYHAAS